MHRTLILLAALLLPLCAHAQSSASSPPLTAGYGRFFNQSTGSSTDTVTATDQNIQIPVCPAGNCPVPPRNPVLTGSFLGGQTTKGSTQAEWLGVDSLYVNTGTPNGQKVGRYIGVTQGPQAGSVWSLNTLTQRGAGNPTGSVGCGLGCIDYHSGTIGYELDFTNWDQSGTQPNNAAYAVNDTITFTGGTCSTKPVLTVTGVGTALGNITGTTITTPGTCSVVPTNPMSTSTSGSGYGALFNGTFSGGALTSVTQVTTAPFTTGMFINTLSSYPATAGIYLATANGQTVPGWGKGLFFGRLTVRDNTIEDETDSTFSYYVGTGHTHNVSFYDDSTSQYGVQINGNHSGAAFLASDTNTPIAYSVTGNQGVAFRVAGSHTVGLQLATATALTHAIELPAQPTGTGTGNDLCFNAAAECVGFDAVQGLTFHTAGLGTRFNGPVNVIPGAAAVSANGAANLFQAQDGGSGTTAGGNIILQAGAGIGGGAFGSVVMKSPLAHSYERKVPTAGTTVSYTDGKEFEVMVPAATLATLTVQLPSCGAARDGQVRGFSSSQVITALTVSGASGATVLGAPTTLAATQPSNRAQFVCVAADTTWYPY